MLGRMLGKAARRVAVTAERSAVQPGWHTETRCV